MLSSNLLIHAIIVLQLGTSIVVGQRSFPNPAVTDPAPCACDLRNTICDPNCCCDLDCTDGDLTVSPICKSTRTSSSYASLEEPSLNQWNCSNNDSATQYDYFPLVCYQLTLNEIIGRFYPTDHVTFLKGADDAARLRSTFVAANPNSFQPISFTVPTTQYSARGAPVLASPNTIFKLPGNLIGPECQADVPVRLGVNRDVACTASSIPNFATTFNTLSVLKDGQSATTVPFVFRSKTYTAPAGTPARDLTTEYYFQDAYALNAADIPSTSGSILDYCPGKHPSIRTQRYVFCSTPNTALCGDQYQTFPGCPLRDGLNYNTIPDGFFTARATSRDDATNFLDFDGATVTPTAPAGGTFRRILYRFTYSSTDWTISSADVFVLLDPATVPSSRVRITIEWTDVSNSASASTTIPRGYLDGEVLQFRRNSATSDVSHLVPTSNGLCIDATRQSLRYKKGFSSQCFLQLTQQTVRQCHDLKLNMYLYLNAFYAPASDVLAYPNATATPIKIRDSTQDSLDLDRIDETRPKNRLTEDVIRRRKLNTTTYTIYDAAQILSSCANVPSGAYIQFGYVRVKVSSTFSYERIVSVQYNYTYSNWTFDCTKTSCADTQTQQYLVTFQSEFVDYTNRLVRFSEVTRADLTSADNYIEHLLWMISPEYKGEPGYRNYTIAMILIFVAISTVVMHVLLFGMVLPF